MDAIDNHYIELSWLCYMTGTVALQVMDLRNIDDLINTMHQL
jgi:hypothetical protein